MHLKKGDNVKVIAGKDRGKSGKITQSFPNLDKVVVEGANVMKKHLRVRRQGDKGQIVEFSSPLTASNVMLICPKCGKPVRIGYKVLTLDGGKTKKVRTCKKCKEAIE